MKAPRVTKTAAASLIVGALFSTAAYAQTPDEQAPRDRDGHRPEKRVKIIGSLIPQRVKVKRIGTATYSNTRVIDRQEIDQSGRFTAAGAIQQNDPSIRIIGH